MAFVVDDFGNITLVQGDNGFLVLDGMPTDKAYIVYFAIQNSDRKNIGEEIQINANLQPIVTIPIPASLTDLLKVPVGEDYETYYYGVKICNALTGTEDTMLLGDSNIGDKNTITVYPKKVEGTV